MAFSGKCAAVVAILAAAGVLHGSEYGTRMNLPDGAVVSADFVDSDGDGVDDRYQPGPGMPQAGKPVTGIPRIECHGGARPEGVPDLRLAMEIRGEYENLVRNRKSQLRPSVRGDGAMRLVPGIVSGEHPSKKIVFPDGFTAWVHEGPDSSALVIVQEGESTRILVRESR